MSHISILLFVFQKDDEYEPSEYQNEYSLHIIETIELELGLNVEDNGEYDSSNTIHLKRDAAVSSRYWCLHNTGVHSVTIPLMELLDEFSKTTSGIDHNNIIIVNNDVHLPSIYYYPIICVQCSLVNTNSTQPNLTCSY